MVKAKAKAKAKEDRDISEKESAHVQHARIEELRYAAKYHNYTHNEVDDSAVTRVVSGNE